MDIQCQLKTVKLKECDHFFSGEELFLLSNLANIQHLDLTGCTSITDNGLKYLAEKK